MNIAIGLCLGGLLLASVGLTLQGEHRKANFELACQQLGGTVWRASSGRTFQCFKNPEVIIIKVSK
jgi:hypothetical protein